MSRGVRWRNKSTIVFCVNRGGTAEDLPFVLDWTKGFLLIVGGIMALSKRYRPNAVETELSQIWTRLGVYQFKDSNGGKVYSIDTPPATVSGNLHLGHVYSYSHPDFIARFWRMNGYNVFYPMGYDDNGLPTERLVERNLGIKAQQIGRPAFINECLQISEHAEKEYEELWKRIGLSIDLRFKYRTIDHYSQKTAQKSFVDLYKQDLVYRAEAPVIWCPECQTAIAQAELHDISRSTTMNTIQFTLCDSKLEPNKLLIATTRPELLPACVAVFVHPEDDRYRHLIGHNCKVPIFGQVVPIMANIEAEREKGTGVVMCCTFGDSMDVAWWYKYDLPLIEAINKNGVMSKRCGQYEGLVPSEAREKILSTAREERLLIEQHPTDQFIRVHERCDTPVEYIVTNQWFVRLLDFKPQLIEIGNKINWHPSHMLSRYLSWVENLNWDWCISRQRYFGVPFPLWYCKECGAIILAENESLPVDPQFETPNKSCSCGSTSFIAEEDVMDTWATSSLTPQIAGRWLGEGDKNTQINPPVGNLYDLVYPFSLRPQAHEIIRTWAFYTIAKSHFHANSIPWTDVMISGWGIAGEGMGKISKSRGGGSISPIEMIDKYSADAVRYWAASTGPGKDSLISESKIEQGEKIITKLWNVARFCAHFKPVLHLKHPADNSELTAADRWILSKTQRLITRVSEQYRNYDYAAAKSATETFFWQDFTDNYLEMCKQRLYSDTAPTRSGALYTLNHVFLTILKLFAPILPFVSETIYQGVFYDRDINKLIKGDSIHLSEWPQAKDNMINHQAEELGYQLVSIATAVRRYKSDNSLPLRTNIEKLQIIIKEPSLRQDFTSSEADLKSITRANEISYEIQPHNDLEIIFEDESLKIGLQA